MRCRSAQRKTIPRMRGWCPSISHIGSKVLLLPGEHTISVRQNGYADFNKTVLIKPGEKQVVVVAMIKGPTGLMPATWATLKIAVNPPRAAVFLDGRFVGHVSEFEGLGRSLQVVPGAHSVKIAH